MIGIGHLPLVIDQNTALANGVKSGQFNREEFVSLANMKNEIAAAQAQLDKENGGILGAINKSTLESKQQQYDKMYQTYRYGDYHPHTAANSQSHQRQLDQLGRIYGGLANGSVTGYEGRNLLNEQQGIARDKVNNPQFSGLGILQIRNDEPRQNQLLDRSSHHIFEAKHNFITDFWPSVPMMF